MVAGSEKVVDSVPIDTAEQSYNEALQIFKTSLGIMRKQYTSEHIIMIFINIGEQHCCYGITSNNLAGLFWKIQQYDTASKLVCALLSSPIYLIFFFGQVELSIANRYSMFGYLSPSM